MALNNPTKVLIGIVIVLFILYLLYLYSNPWCNTTSNNENDGFTNIPQNIENNDKIETFNPNNDDDDDLSDDNNLIQNFNSEESDCKDDLITVDQNLQKEFETVDQNWVNKKFYSKNKAKKGYKTSKYNSGNRFNNGPGDWENYFDNNNNILVGSNNNQNDKFLPIDETCGGYASFKSKGKEKCGSNQHCEPEDLFNADNYLPKEVRDDWFEVPEEPISVKNRHLINVSKPIGQDTIGTSLRNPSYDLRASPPNPKFSVGPFNQSTISPDNNLKAFN